jgi:hypothetical protein
MRPQRWAWCLPAAVCLCFASCVDTDKPLTDPEEATPDTRLLGLWKLSDGEHTVEFHHVGKAGEPFADSVYRTVAVGFDADGVLDRPDGNLDSLVVPTKLGDNRYLSIGLVGKDKYQAVDTHGLAGAEIDNYMLMKYKIENDKITLWMTNSKAKIKAVESGKVAGVVKGNDARLTDIRDNLRTFVTENDAELFSDDPVVMTRVE